MNPRYSLLLLGFCTPVLGADGLAIYTHGGAKPAAMACASCHGADGMGMAAAGFPRIAGLPEAYLERQMRAYREGLRANPVMQPIAAALTEDETRIVLQYVSTLPVPAYPQITRAAEARDAGAVLALRGDWPQGIPECVSCHGPGGVGVGGDFPPLVGQPENYLMAQLDAWRKGTRKGDPQDLMGRIARAMNEAQVSAAAGYFSALKPGTAVPAQTTDEPASKTANAAPPPSAAPSTSGFTPPAEDSLGDDPFSQLVRQGRALFVDTAREARPFVGNGMNCVNCHLDQGRLGGSGPLWGAYPMYPAWRVKDKAVDSYADRLRGCFRFSMNGTEPPVDGPVIQALAAYSYWLSTGARIGVAPAGRGYPAIPEPAGGYDLVQGQKVYGQSCAICHGTQGQGMKVGEGYVFPPLWGADSYNWGAGMARLDYAAAFIHTNMPLGQGNTLSPADAWHVAAYMNSHERPRDPRMIDGSVEKTRAAFHAGQPTLYGATVNGVRLGAGTP